MIEDVSCIRFQQQREVQHKDYIEFLAGRGCYSQVGRSGYGKQEIFLRRECAQVGTHLIVHEVSQWLYRWWGRMMETVYVGDNYEMLVTTSSHQQNIVIKITMAKSTLST